jgi:DNA-binding NtrC family response regulator
MMSEPILYLLDDEAQILERFERLLGSQFPSARIKCFFDANDFKEAIAKSPPVDVFVIDAFLDRSQNPTGLGVVEFCRRLYPSAVIVLSSSSADLRLIRDSIGRGADDFVAKEASPETVLATVSTLLQAYDERKQGQSEKLATYVGKTMKDIALRVPRVLQSAVNCVYIEGESGSGKEIVANLFEKALSPGVPFVKLNCAALSPQLISSELFGHVKGAFTGAIADKEGLLGAADGGWIFLDEIALLPVEAQGALLRALDNHTLRRLGSNKDQPLDIRVISATNESLAKKVEEGAFRKDLWQRLCETVITVPPLRLRRHEIPELVDHFCITMRGGPYTLAPRVLDVLQAYDWREGNVRQLRNALRAMTEKAINKILTPNSIPIHIWDAVENMNDDPMGRRGLRVTWKGDRRPEFDGLVSELLLELIKAEFKSQGRLSVRGLAKALGIPKSSMPAKIKALIDSNLVAAEEIHKMIKLADAE